MSEYSSQYSSRQPSPRPKMRPRQTFFQKYRRGIMLTTAGIIGGLGTLGAALLYKSYKPSLGKFNKIDSINEQYNDTIKSQEDIKDNMTFVH